MHAHMYTSGHAEGAHMNLVRRTRVQKAKVMGDAISDPQSHHTRVPLNTRIDATRNDWSIGPTMRGASRVVVVAFERNLK